MITIELLYFDDCPSWQTTRETLQQVLDELNLSAEIALIPVETPEDAIDKQFVGSPTVRVNGEDLFPASHDDYALGCRVYDTPEGLAGSPTPAMLRDALQAHEATG